MLTLKLVLEIAAEVGYMYAFSDVRLLMSNRNYETHLYIVLFVVSRVKVEKYNPNVAIMLFVFRTK